MTVEPTAFLYPFIEADERDGTALVEAMAASAQAKIGHSRSLRALTVAASSDAVGQAGRAMASRLAAGGRLLAFGNGGSATDADAAVALFRNPAHGRSLAALSLVAEPAVLSALANDVGIDVIFARQIEAHARLHDVALGFSTSGSSTNVVRALDEAHRRGVLTVGLAGYGGGAMADLASLDHCLVVSSDSVHRIQETQTALVHRLWSVVQSEIAGNPS